jgi:NTE family protein
MHRIKMVWPLMIAVVLMVSACATRDVLPPSKPAKVAVVLGAGASKGFAHIGVLKILESQKIPIHMIVGTSVGSFVGSLYAYGYDGMTLHSIALTLEKDAVADLTFPDNGFIKGERLRDYVNNTLRNTPIEKLRIPFYAVATNIQTGEEIVFGTGNTGMAVQASCSVPGIFQPAKFSGGTYVDGGVVNPIAVDVARRYGADVVIAVDISAGIDNLVPTTTMETILKSVDIMYEKMSVAQRGRADVVIRPKVANVGSADFSKRHEAILAGEKAALEVLPQLQTIIKKLRDEGRLPR